MARKASMSNPSCPYCQSKHVIRNGHKDSRQRWRCQECRRTFGPTYGTPLYRLHNSDKEVAHSLLVVMRRGSLCAAEEITGHKYETLGRWLRSVAEHAEAITTVLVHDLNLTEVEVDAFWSFVKKHCPQATPDSAESGVGPRWGCFSMDRPTRFVIAWDFAASEDEAAPQVVRLTRQRTARGQGVPWVSDGKSVYRREVARVYRDPVRTGRRGRPALKSSPGVGLTQVVKQRQGWRVVRVEVRHVLGVSLESPYTVHEERMNGSLRDRLACLTRRTHAFAKQSQMWDAAVALELSEHNWLRPHRALREAAPDVPNGQIYRRRTPVVAIGLTDHIWTWEEFLNYPVCQYQME